MREIIQTFRSIIYVMSNKGAVGKIIIGIFLFFQPLVAQEQPFVKTSGINFTLNDKPFYPVGVNCYYLQNLAANGDTQQVVDIFREAKQNGVNVIRSWGFFDSPDSANPAVIQIAPGKISERGLQALDFVIAKAGAYNIKLIIPLVNNWDDYGGMNQYVEWLAEQQTGKRTSLVENQKWINGTGERKYRMFVSDNLTHDDFYTNVTIKGWFKYYVQSILNRFNVYTQTFYKDDPSIMMWELANEPRSSDPTGGIVYNWIQEISEYLKFIDNNHLLGTGEEGMDVTTIPYPQASKFPAWMFNGTSGVSFSKNIKLSQIDAGSIHIYPESWRLNSSLTNAWIIDHSTISGEKQKPLIIGEVGFRTNKSLFYDVIFDQTLKSKASGLLLWQISFPGNRFVDAYSFDCTSDPAICGLIKRYSSLFENRDTTDFLIPKSFDVVQNFPNPFNRLSMFTYRVQSERFILLEVYNVIGQRVTVLADHIHPAGEYRILFDGNELPNGAYFVMMRHSGGYSVKKILLLR